MEPIPADTEGQLHMQIIFASGERYWRETQA